MKTGEKLLPSLPGPDVALIFTFYFVYKLHFTYIEFRTNYALTMRSDNFSTIILVYRINIESFKKASAFKYT